MAGALGYCQSIKEELNRKENSAYLYETSIRQDKAWFENDTGFAHTYFLETKGVVNKKGFQKLFFTFNDTA